MRSIGVLMTAVLLTVATPGFAQDTSRGEVSAGWRYYHTTIHSVASTALTIRVPNDFAKGWYADAAVNLSPKFAVVGEAGGTYFSDDASNTVGTITARESLDVKFHTFMGGVRVRAPQLPWFVPFGQVLFGGERDRAESERSVTFGGNTNRNRLETATSNATLALDSGVSITVAGSVGVRASVGYARMFSRADADAFRFSLGGVFRF